MPRPRLYRTRGSLGMKREVSYHMNHRNMDVASHKWLQGGTGGHCGVGRETMKIQEVHRKAGSQNEVRPNH